MKPEEKARQDIDNLLTKAGWVIQDMDEINLGTLALHSCPKSQRYVLSDYKIHK